MVEVFKDIIPALQHTKVNVLVSEDDEKKYNAFLVNKAMSHHMDTVMFANVMNENSHLSKKMQFDYYLYTIRAMRRPYKKWNKFQSPENIEVIREYYKCSTPKAIEILKLLTDDQLQTIIKRISKGGVDNARKHDRGKTKGKK